MELFPHGNGRKDDDRRGISSRSKVWDSLPRPIGTEMFHQVSVISQGNLQPALAGDTIRLLQCSALSCTMKAQGERTMKSPQGPFFI